MSPASSDDRDAMAAKSVENSVGGKSASKFRFLNFGGGNKKKRAEDVSYSMETEVDEGLSFFVAPPQVDHCIGLSRNSLMIDLLFFTFAADDAHPGRYQGRPAGYWTCHC